MVIISIRIKMVIIYSLIIILTFSTFGYIILNNYRTKAITNEETRLFQTANVVADTYKRNMEDIIFARIMVKSYANQTNGRIIVLDNNKIVLIDSYNSYTDKLLDNKEVRNSLDNKSTSGLYSIDDKEVLQLAVPITLNTGLQNEVIGTVLISSSINQINEDVKDLENDIFKVAISSLSIALILAIISVTGITKSLKTLIFGVEKISSGHLGYQINKSEGGEIGKLIDTFNDMSSKLSAIEKNRKHLINSISHELKTPLTSMRALIDSLFMGNNSIDTYNEYLNDIRDETIRMDELIRYLMGSIKLEEVSLDKRTENLDEILEESVKIIRPYAEKNGVEIKLDIIRDFKVECDRNKVKEVFLNLIENAIKYKDTNKSRNYVLIKLDKSKGKLILTIDDNGIGIKTGDLDSIFNRGFRVMDSSKIEGYGIGLALVKNIIDKHNWSINVKSEESIGTLFTIEI